MRKNALHLHSASERESPQVSGKFGTALWRHQMIFRVQKKMQQGIKLDDFETAFVSVELDRADES